MEVERDEEYIRLWRANDDHCAYYENGRITMSRLDPIDIVEGPLADEPEMAGLSGYAVIDENGWVIWQTAVLAKANANAAGDAEKRIVDLSKVPASAIVQPKSQPVTRTVWLNIYSDGESCWLSREQADKFANEEERIACIEREIIYHPGEGLKP